MRRHRIAYKTVGRTRRSRRRMLGNAAFTITVALALFFTSAGLTGAFFAKNVVAPAMGYLGMVELDDSIRAEKENAPTPKKEGNTIKIPGCTVYFLQTGAYGVESNAADAAASISDQGGAGYTIPDGNTARVILQAYRDEGSAKQVKERLSEEKGIHTSIYTVTKADDEVEVEGSAEQAETMGKVLARIGQGLDQLNEAALRVEEGEAALDRVKQGMEDFQRAREELEAVYPDAASATVPGRLNTYCNDIIAQCKKTAGETGVAFISSTRYLQVMAYHGYCDFLSSL